MDCPNYFISVCEFCWLCWPFNKIHILYIHMYILYIISPGHSLPTLTGSHYSWTVQSFQLLSCAENPSHLWRITHISLIPLSHSLPCALFALICFYPVLPLPPFPSVFFLYRVSRVQGVRLFIIINRGLYNEIQVPSCYTQPPPKKTPKTLSWIEKSDSLFSMVLSYSLS